jgi:hypothetical protein
VGCCEDESGSAMHILSISARLPIASNDSARKKLETLREMSQMILLMNAAEIIEHIKQLPPGERGKVVAFARHLPNEETLQAIKEAEHPEKLEHFESAADLFDKLGVKC